MTFTVVYFAIHYQLHEALVAFCVVNNVFEVSVQTESSQLSQQFCVFEIERENFYVYYKTWVHAVKGSITVAGN